MNAPTTLSSTPRLFGGLLLLGMSSLSALAIDPDLPFRSGSTGADGPLTFRQIVAGGRAYHGAAYDAVRRQLIAFGGYVSQQPQSDTWAFDDIQWTRLLPASSPVQRYGHRLVWDGARQEIILFGGHRGDIRLNDTWTWNGTTWTQKNPASSPSPREHFGMTYDAARQRVVLFGGNNGADETWLWDGSNWTQANPARRPPAHSNHALAYDAARQQVVLFGGHGQTWLWDGVNWTQATPATLPAARNHLAMDYDPVRQVVVLFSGSNLRDTWTWNGSNWTPMNPTTQPPGRQFHSLSWNPQLQAMVLLGGDVPGVDPASADTWFWNGSDWSFLSGKVQTFNMTSRADGIWHFSTIHVPAGVTVRFARNADNTPVRWLATGDVQINGALDLNGDLGANDFGTGQVAKGGPGGYDGGRGGIRFDASTSYVGSPGQGPGGGNPGTAQQVTPTNLRDGQDAQHAGSYGNAFLQPLTGGSGGGGGSSSDTVNGGHGGGGGGAILIASSRDIILNGKISANGGSRQFSGASQGGRGSGGSILLRADRVSGPGSLEAFGGENNNPNGRIRVEAYVRTLNGSSTPVTVVGLPAANSELNQAGALRIVSVDGANVIQPSTGNLLSPDVVFSDAGPVSVVVNGAGIPNGTSIKLRITTANSVIEPAPQIMNNGAATFSVTVPKGLGTLQASAQFKR